MMASGRRAPYAPAEGFLLVARPDGGIERVVGDRIGVPGLEVGASWIELLDEGSRTKAQRFLRFVERDGVAYGWELAVRLASQPAVLCFMGASHDGRFWIAASRRTSEMARLYPHLLTIAGVEGRSSPTSVNRSFDQYEEIARLNGQLIGLHRQVLAQNRELQRILNERNQLLGVVAHDLRSPLAVIRLGCDFLQRDLDALSPDQQRLLEDMTSACGSMKRMLGQLLDHSKIEAGYLELHREPCDLASLVAHVVRRHDILGMQRGVRVVLTASSPIPTVSADAGRIEEVLDNLIGNAVKFSPADERVEVIVRPYDDRVSVAVCDRGPGIPEEDQKRLFRPYATGSTRPPSGDKGTGLGLAIVDKIIRGHQGSIRYDSAVGEGTTVTFELPVHAAPTATRTA